MKLLGLRRTQSLAVYLAILTVMANACAGARSPALQDGPASSPPLVVITVVDTSGQGVPGALVFAAGSLLEDRRDERRGIAVTDQKGELHVGRDQVLQTPVALAVQFVKPANDPAHACPSNEPWSYAVYQTSLRWTDQGDASSVAVQQDDTLELTLQPLHPLILFNLVVSLDWKTTPKYRAQLKQGLELGSDYLFDLTDGQMAFGHVVINDNKAAWDRADIHVQRNNTICPQASISARSGMATTHQAALGQIAIAFERSSTSLPTMPWGYTTST
jgi:hypothetical protein